MLERLFGWWPALIPAAYFLVGLWAGLANNPS